ncbi:hypothetical protein ACRALDRAFT_2082023, partial [Sodiomyces alcalophilus JCM 7366]|uniref:uncharacterized protein n=1 Tax=Sodiomyces alcalophilus JCM 7366 TaxID=591952 RepID=UPI0039B48601
SIANSVTVIITTSPTPSAPSTDLLSAVTASFSQHCPSLLTCPVIVIFDTFDRVSHIPRLKKGQVTPEGVQAYESYRGNVQDLILRTWALNGRRRHSDIHRPNSDEDGDDKGDGEWAWTTRHVDAEFGSPGEREEGKNAVRVTIRRATGRGDVTFIEPHARLGFALAVRSALRETRTPYVWVHQHDWTLEEAIPLAAMVGVMKLTIREDEDGREPPPVRYISLVSARMLRYADSGQVQMFPALRALTASLRREFRVDDVTGGLPLTPLFFWHDKPHLADRRHYLARVFSSRLAVGRGMFIEDSVGHRARDQMKEGRWARWGSWLYYPSDGEKVCVRHLHGRRWKG